MSKYLALFDDFSTSNFFDIFIVAMIIYVIYTQVAKTTALPAIQGFFIIIFITLLSSMFNLTTLNYILTNVVSIMLLSAIILFPSEIRSSLYRIGGMAVFRRALRLESRTVRTLGEALTVFKKQRIGALIVMQNKDSLPALIETGVRLNADIESSVLYAIFQKSSPLHDGAVIIRDDRLVAAACYIQNLSSALRMEKNYGTRHRAALSLSEQSDALVIVVSEETGQISVALRSNLIMSVSVQRLTRILNDYFNFKAPAMKSRDRRDQKTFMPRS